MHAHMHTPHTRTHARTHAHMHAPVGIKAQLNPPSPTPTHPPACRVIKARHGRVVAQAEANSRAEEEEPEHPAPHPHHPHDPPEHKPPAPPARSPLEELMYEDTKQAALQRRLVSGEGVGQLVSGEGSMLLELCWYLSKNST